MKLDIITVYETSFMFLTQIPAVSISVSSLTPKLDYLTKLSEVF